MPARCSARGKEEQVVPLFACRIDGVDKAGVKCYLAIEIKWSEFSILMSDAQR